MKKNIKKTIKKTIILSIIVVLLIPLIYSYYSYSKIKVSNRYADEFYRDLINVVSQADEFDMTDVTKFEWDKMIVFYPYTSREEMVKRIGQEWTTYSYLGYHFIEKSFLGSHPLDDDSLNKIVFIKGEKVVLDVIFNRRQVDLTKIEQTINREEAQFNIQNNVLEHIGSTNNKSM